MNQRNIKTASRAGVAWLVALLVLFSNAFLGQSPASAQELTEVPLSATTTSSSNITSGNYRYFFTTTVQEAATDVQDFTVDIPNNATTKITVPYAYNLIKIGNTVVARNSSAQPGEIVMDSISRDSTTGEVTIHLQQPLTLQPGDTLTVEIAFKARMNNLSGSTVHAYTSAVPEITEEESSEPSPEPSTPNASETTDPTEPETTDPVGPGTSEPTTPSNPDSDFKLQPIGYLTMEKIQSVEDNPARISGTFAEDTNFEKAIFEVVAPNGILDIEYYTVNISLIETGVKFDYDVIEISKDRVAIEVYPVQNGKRLPSALVPAGSEIVATGSFSPVSNIEKFKLDVYGNRLTEEIPEPEVVVDDLPYLPDAVENPPLQLRCGQNIAIVFDLSGSNERNGGIAGLKEAGNRVIDTLAGSAANISLYNYATYSAAVPAAQQIEPLNLSSEENIRTLKSKIANLRAGSPGGTNWEGGLRQVYDSGIRYDAVFFVTDGMVSTNNEQTAKDGDGYWTHTKDMAAAIEAANLLKKQGTHIEGYFVLEPPSAYAYPEYLLKDDVYPTVQIGTSDRFSQGEYAVGPGQGYFLGEGVDTGRVSVLHLGSTNVTNNQPLWTDGRLNPTQMMNLVVGPNQFNNDQFSQTSLSNWKEFAIELKEAVMVGCMGNLIVNKEIVDEEGNFLSVGTGWEFTATTEGRNIVTKYLANGAPDEATKVNNQTLVTNADGQVEFGMDSDKDLPVRVSESIPNDSSFNLYQQNGKNATCKRVVYNSNTGSIVEETVNVTNDGDTGFSLTMLYDSSIGAVRSVECLVQNFETNSPDFPSIKIDKLEYDPNTQAPVANNSLVAYFTIFGSDASGAIDYNNALLELQSGSEPVVSELEAGDYWIVETKAPNNFQLLPQPMKLNLSVTDGKWNGSVENGAPFIMVADNDTVNEVWIQVADIRTGDLPKTGGYGVWIWALLGLVLAGIGVVDTRRKA